jgi:D-2-hydroxyacid dehydrogenase (NADP+)
MQVLIMERGTHIDPDAIRRDCPALDIVYVKTRAEAEACCAEAEVLVAMAHEVEDSLLSRMPRLRYISALTTGVEHLDSLGLLRDDVIVTNGRGIHGPQMSELSFLYMIALSRDFRQMLDNQRESAWKRWPQRLIFHKTITIVGIGTIAEDLALRCKAFGMQVIGVSDARQSARGFDRIMPRRELKQAASLADFLVVLVPLSRDTHHMIDGDVFDAMKPSAVVINIARGPVVHQADLTARLLAGRLGGAGLDVFETEPLPADDPLWKLPNVIVTPRIGGMSDTYAEQVHDIVVHNLDAFAAGRVDEMQNLSRPARG